MSERKGTRGLELWCKKLVKDCPNVQIDNMTTSWRNGIAFCAMVHHFRPDLIDLSKLKPENIYDNNKLAFSIAEKELGIPALLDPEDMVENDVPDRLSVLTYLSQFYRLLGHKVKKTAQKQELKHEPHIKTSPVSEPKSSTIQFGKIGLDKCAACDLPVYLAQRLFVSQKLYHRRCFRCYKCSGQLNPKNFELVEGSQLYCDNCKNESSIISKLLNNNDQMGMLAYNDKNDLKSEVIDVKSFSTKPISRPQSVLEKISLFEKNYTKDSNTQVEDKFKNNSLTDNSSQLKYTDTFNITKDLQHNDEIDKINKKTKPEEKLDFSINTKENIEIDNFYNKKPEKVYKTNTNQLNFLQTQLSNVVLDTDSALSEAQESEKDCIIDVKENEDKKDTIENDISIKVIDESNITDDSRIAISLTSNIDSSIVTNESTISIDKDVIAVPPRRKKHLNLKKNKDQTNEIENQHKNTAIYPEDLNPFSDDDEIQEKDIPKKLSTNPFGSSDEEDDSVPPINTSKATAVLANPQRRVISANPFWSDGEDPSSDDEIHSNSSSMHKSSMTTSTPNLPGSGRRKKGRAPAPPAPLAPPPVLSVLAPPSALGILAPASALGADDDRGSVSSLNSYNSTANSDYKSYGKSTPILKRLAPTPSDSLSNMSAGGGSIEKGMDTSETRNSSTENVIRRVKGPAPGLPLPERREVKLQMSPEELQVQLDMLETQQLGLERQGVLIEQMIRQKCEGDEACSAPQEEVEDLVIQLCEIVNEKNDLFRKQTELMYIRRQQRLEQEQADIEHEIRIIQSRPAVNRIDADKAREEQLVSRLVQVVRLRDELVQQLDAERRRERQEDIAIAASIATKRAQRHSDSTSSSMQSEEALTIPKKNKMKDKVKKQLKKAKHTLIPKKKDDTSEHKIEKAEKKK